MRRVSQPSVSGRVPGTDPRTCPLRPGLCEGDSLGAVRDRSHSALLALVVVTAVWGLTFVQVKDAVALYPLFAFLAVRFAIASLVLAVPAAPAAALARPQRRGRRARARPPARGGLRAPDGRARADDGLERRLHHRALRRLHAAPRAAPLPDARRAASSGSASGWRSSGSRCCPASAPATRSATLLVLAGSAAYSLQIVLMERYAPRYDAIAFTQVEMLAAFGGFAVVAVAAGQVEVPQRLDGLGGAARHGHLRERARPSSSRRGRSGGRPRRGPRSPSRWSPSSPGSSASGSPATGSARSAGRAARVIMAGIVVAEPEAGRTLRRLVPAAR